MRSKADSADIKRLQEEKASAIVLDEVVKRLNKMEEKIKFELHN